MKCNKCGCENKKGSMLCIRCGNRLDDEHFNQIINKMYTEAGVVPKPEDNVLVSNAQTPSSNQMTNLNQNNQGESTNQINKPNVNQVNNSVQSSQTNNLNISNIATGVNENKIDNEDPSMSYRKAHKEDAKKKPTFLLCVGLFTQILIIALVGVLLVVQFFNIITFFTDALTPGGNISDIRSFLNNYGGLLFALTIICGFISIILHFGNIGASLKISREEKLKISDFILIPFRNFHNIFMYWLFFVILNVCITAISWIPIINLILLATPILFIYYFPAFQMMLVMSVDDNYKTDNSITLFKEANYLVSGRRMEYYAMEFSFILWLITLLILYLFLLMVPITLIIVLILFIVLIVYRRLSLLNMYRGWLGETTYTKEECMGDKKVVLFGVLILLLFLSLLSLF